MSCSSSGTIIPKTRLNKTSVEPGHPIEIQYSFTTTPNFSVPFSDLTVFVHFVDAKNVRRFQDDHIPVKNIQEWKPGANYEWTRTVFIPKNVSPGEYSIILGMYSPSKKDRIILAAQQYSRRSYKVGNFVIKKPSGRPLLEYVSGWYNPETDPSNAQVSWRWMRGEAILKAPNPKSDATFYLKVEGVPQRFQTPQRLSVSVNGTVLDAFAINRNEPLLKKYKLTKVDVSKQNEIEIKLYVDKTFIPASDGVSRDTRELGVLVHYAHLDFST